MKKLNTTIFSKLNIKELVIIFLVSLVMGVIFAIPLKSLCKLSGAPFWSLLLLSGFISYINAKVVQQLKQRNKDPNVLEFLYIFSLSISLIFFTTMIGYPFAGYIISSGDVLSIISVKKNFLWFY